MPKPSIGWEKLCGGAAIVTLIGAFLPWASAHGTSYPGTDSEGQLTLVCAIIGLASIAIHRGVDFLKAGRRVTLVTQSILAALVTVLPLLNVSTASTFGLYLTFLAGCAWVAGAVIGWRSPPSNIPIDEYGEPWSEDQDAPAGRAQVNKALAALLARDPAGNTRD
jgi:hypothetical protein